MKPATPPRPNLGPGELNSLLARVSPHSIVLCPAPLARSLRRAPAAIVRRSVPLAARSTAERVTFTGSLKRALTSQAVTHLATADHAPLSNHLTRQNARHMQHGSRILP